MSEITLDDLAEEAAGAAEEAAGESTGEWLKETVELLDKRGLLEPMLFGADRLPDNDPTPAVSESGAGVDLNASTIAQAGRGIMDEMGEDTTVADLVAICENNPALVNQRLDQLGTDEETPADE